jgi:hypothetical protein
VNGNFDFLFFFPERTGEVGPGPVGLAVVGIVGIVVLLPSLLGSVVESVRGTAVEDWVSFSFSLLSFAIGPAEDETELEVGVWSGVSGSFGDFSAGDFGFLN